MSNVIDVQPKTLDLALYAGDGVDFDLVCVDSNNSPIDLSGSIEAQIRLDRSDASSSLADFAADMDQAQFGTVGLSLTGDQTQELITDESGKFTGVWDVQWTPTGKQPRTLCQGKVECVADVTR